MNPEVKIAIQQRVLTPYRAVFFDALAAEWKGGVEIFAGLPRAGESIAATRELKTAGYTFARNVHLFHGGAYMCHQPGMIGWLERIDPQVLIVEANPRYLATPAAVRWMKDRWRLVLGWGLGSPSVGGWMGAFRKNRRLALLGAMDGLFTYSRRGAAEYAALGFPAGRIYVAPNAAVDRPARPLPVRPESFQGKPCVLFVGRLQARKRLDALLRACAALPAALQPRLVIVGDGPEREPLQALAGSIYPSAEFAGTRLGEELEPFFLQANLFVLPGTGGLAVQEAMAHGLPVIMGQGDGTSDDLVTPGNGWQCPDAGKLPAVLAEALSDASRLRRMGAESYRIVSEEVNLGVMVRVFTTAISGLLDRQD